MSIATETTVKEDVKIPIGSVVMSTKMDKIKRLTTDTSEGNYEWIHNMTCILDKKVYLRRLGNEEYLSIVEYCIRECKSKCGSDIDAGAEEFGDYMDCNCPVSLFYHMAIGHAELRERLKKYEDAEEEGRLIVVPEKDNL